MGEWGFDYGDNSKMQQVSEIVFAGTAEDATARLHNLHPAVDELRVAILVRTARRERNAGRTGGVNEAIHDLTLLLNRAGHDDDTTPPADPTARRPGFAARLRFWWRWGR